MAKFRLLHTSDWHLGRRLHDHPRDYEQRLFLEWLLAVLEDEQIDALLVAGDLFDSRHPSAQSQQLFTGFLTAVEQRLPRLQIVIVGGEQDALVRLDATPALARPGVHVFSAFPKSVNGSLDVNRCIITLHGSDSNPAACLAAVPYLHPEHACVRSGAEDSDQRLIDAVSAVYRQVCEAVIRQAGPERSSILTGHLYVNGCRTSEGSERRIQNRYRAGLPAGTFPAQLSYVALGHLHLAQAVSDNVYYSGSPLPLSFGETNYCHQLLIAEFEGPSLVDLRAVQAPRPVAWLRIPCDGPEPPDVVLQEVRRLEDREGRDPSSPERPYLEVLVNGTRPGLSEEIRREIEGKWPRLLKITLIDALRDCIESSGKPADELNQETIFRHCYRHKYSSAQSILDEPSEQLMQAFRLLWQEQESREL